MKVNMTPNPLDVVTIHASQGDTEARQWEFELHNNGELIDTSDVKEQMVFKAYKGGTEQLLPENTSVPTTTPILADIQYPDGLRTDQYFTYRETPTTVSNKARIKTIKGNTLVWNQLIASNETVNLNRDSARTYNISTNNTRSVVGHKYYFATTITSDNTNGGLNCRFGSDFNVGKGVGRHSTMFTANDTNNASIYCYIQSNEESGTALSFKDTVLIDLTIIGLDSITSADEFTSLFSLPYYAYNQGSLLSFNGNGIKTIGKNLLNPSFTTINAYINGYGVITLSSNDKSVIVPLLPNLDYVFTWNKGEILSSVTDDTQVGLYNEYPSKGMQGVFAGNTSVSGNNIRFNSGTNKYAVIKIANITRTDFDSTIIGSQLEFGTTPSSYEPYTSSTLSLPISTYFPNGMNGHGNTYDELTSAVATKRFEKASLGDLTWIRRTTNIFSASLPSEFDVSKGISCFMSNRLPTVFVSGYTLAEDGYISIYKIEATTFSKSIYLNMASQSIDTVADLQTWLSSNPTELVYPLATPTETSFTTASLVTENAEIPLSNDDGTLIGKCTEELSAEPGFHDAKIKLADSDGECYSNKIQLHVERSPQ